eukprot:scaffold102567_cov18-Tisochrysis_lutea.AAC.1
MQLCNLLSLSFHSSDACRVLLAVVLLILRPFVLAAIDFNWYHWDVMGLPGVLVFLPLHSSCFACITATRQADDG